MCQALRTTFSCGHTRISSGVCYAFPGCSNVQAPRSQTVEDAACEDCGCRVEERKRLWEWHRRRLGVDREVYWREKMRIEASGLGMGMGREGVGEEKKMAMGWGVGRWAVGGRGERGGTGGVRGMGDKSGVEGLKGVKGVGTMGAVDLMDGMRRKRGEEMCRTCCFDFEELSVHLPGLFVTDSGGDGDGESDTTYSGDETLLKREGLSRAPWRGKRDHLARREVRVSRDRDAAVGDTDTYSDSVRELVNPGASGGSVLSNGEIVYELQVLGDGSVEVVEETGQRARLRRREQRVSGVEEWRKREERKVWFSVA